MVLINPLIYLVNITKTNHEEYLFELCVLLKKSERFYKKKSVQKPLQEKMIQQIVTNLCVVCIFYTQTTYL